MTIQDVSCVGKCSLTVALPIISAAGVECGVLPTAVLSTHTAGFTGFTFRDLTEDMPAICAHWKKEGITFDGIYKNSRVWINSYYLGERPNGYISFTYDVTKQFHFESRLNISHKFCKFVDIVLII